MAYIDKLPSGSYRIRKTYQGKQYSLTVDFKPRKNEADQLIANLIEKDPVQTGRLTFRRAAESYIAGRSNILSPSTIRGYEQMLQKLPDWLTMKQISRIDSDDLQQLVNECIVGHSPKTVKNIHGFVVSVIRHKRRDFSAATKLPQRSKNEFYVPSRDDVRRILDHERGTEYYIPLCLAVYGLRRSEVFALELSDIGEGEIRISKARVKGPDEKWHVKTTKTVESTRTIHVDPALTDLIRSQGYITRVSQNSILKHLHSVQKALGIPQFPLHEMRHYFATESIANGIDPLYVAQMGGWVPGTKVMEKVYTHIREEKLRADNQKLIGIMSDVIRPNGDS